METSFEGVIVIVIVTRVFNEDCESRNSHRYAVIVQDLAIQWLQASPCKTKTFQETMKSLQKILESKSSPKVIHTDNSLEFGRTCKDLQCSPRISFFIVSTKDVCVPFGSSLS